MPETAPRKHENGVSVVYYFAELGHVRSVLTDAVQLEKKFDPDVARNPKVLLRPPGREHV